MQIGAYKGNGSDGVSAMAAEFVPWLGRRPDLAIDFLDHSSWPALKNDAGWSIPAWANVVPQLCVAVPLTCTGTPLSTVAAAKRDYAFKLIARLLRNNGFPRAIIRLGHEANGGWYPWGNLTSAALQADYIAAFRHVVAAMRSVAGTHFQFDWCTAAYWQQIGDKSLIYPGDDVVDFIGMDIEPQDWGTTNPSADQCMAALQQGWSLDWLPGFAKAHNKPISFPELGVGDSSSGYGPGDNGDLAARLMSWAKDNALAYVGFWDFDAGDYNSRFSTGERPNCAAAFRTAVT